MDDYNLSVLIESKNEWCARLVNLLTPCIFDGLKSIYDESLKICKEEGELEKYLMTFQNLLTAVPKWSPEIIGKEVQNIIDKTKCGYIEDLISCVHIAHLKSLTSARVGTQQKKIDIDIPNLPNFIHKTYINTARKIYSNIFLYELNQVPLQKQKNNREIEYIIKECILNTIRENIPVEQILRAYIDETEETEFIIDEKKEVIPLENKKVKSIENKIIKNDRDSKIQNECKSVDKEIKLENNELNIDKEIDNLLNDKNNLYEDDNNEINVDTEISTATNDKNLENEEKIKVAEIIDDLPIDLDNLNSDVEDLELELDELP